jgi:hypothetical protein
MKFSGTLLDEGVQLLERTVLPACLKTGKKAYVLLSGETVSFVQDEPASGGMIVSARLGTGQLFDLGSFLCTSRTDDLICLYMSLDILLKALRSARGHGAEHVNLSLKHRSLAASRGGSPVPLIDVRWRNDTISIEQEIPIDKPCPVAEVRRIQGLSGVGAGRRAPCGFYVDVDPAELGSILGILDSFRGLSARALVSVTRGGDFCLVAQAGLCRVGVAFPLFDVFDEFDEFDEFDVDRREDARGRDARRDDHTGRAGSPRCGRRDVEVRVGHLVQALKSVQTAQPSRILCGISDEKDFMHVKPLNKQDDVALPSVLSHSPGETWSLDFRIPGGVDDSSS